MLPSSAEPLTLSTNSMTALRELAGSRSERREESVQQRREVAMQAQPLQQGEAEREQRNDGEHRRVDEAHRA